MDVNILNSFVKSTVNACETMAFIKPTLSKPYIVKGHADSSKLPMCDISSVIGVTGVCSGTIVVSLKKDLAMKLAGNMLGEEMTELSADVKDAVGEIGNLIAGGSKGHLSELGMSFKISTPTVIVGENHIHNYPNEIPTIIIPFETEFGVFYIEACLKVTKKA